MTRELGHVNVVAAMVGCVKIEFYTSSPLQPHEHSPCEPIEQCVDETHSRKNIALVIEADVFADKLAEAYRRVCSKGEETRSTGTIW